MLSNKIYQYLSLLLVSTMLTGCTSCNEEQGQLTTVQGKVLEAGTNNPAIGASVVMWHNSNGFPVSEGSIKQLSKEIITDSTGAYSIAFFNTRRSVYAMQVAPNALFDCSETEEIDIGEKNFFDFIVPAQSPLLELQFKKTDFSTNPDSVAVSVYFENTCLINHFEINNYVRSTNLNVDSTLQIFTQPTVLVNLQLDYFENEVLVKEEEISLATETELRAVEVEY